MPYWAWIIIAVGLVALVPILIQYISIRLLKRSCRISEGFLMGRLRFIVYVTGQVRAGKTTFAAGYTNIRTKYLMQKARKRIEFTCLAEPDVPFDKVDEILKEDFQNGNNDTYKEARKLLAKDMPLETYRNLEYDNRVAPHPVPFIELLESYINAYWALLRNNYVYYYGKAFYSQVTHTDAMDYDPTMLSIKDRALTGDYHVLPYTVIFEDERQLSGKDNQTSHAYAKADSGGADFLRLIGQIGQESIFYVTTNQYWGTDINRERMLATDIISMDKSYAMNPYFLPRFFIACYELPFRFIRWIREKTDKTDPVTPLERKSGWRKALSKSMMWRKYWVSKGYVRFKGVIYHSAADFGKSKAFASKGIDLLRATIPLKMCYGSVNTFQFYSVQRELLSRSKWTLKDEPKAIEDSELANRVLMKREEIYKEDTEGMKKKKKGK